MGNATVCLAWRPQPGRIAAYEYVKRYWNHHGFTVVEADSDPEQPFFWCEARNNAVRKAPTDVVVIADADTFPEYIEQIHLAVEGIRRGCWDFVWPYGRTVHIPMELAEGLTEDVETSGWVEEGLNPGGIVVTRQDAFWGLGGFDECFTPGVWGFNDCAFLEAAQTLARVSHFSGTIFAFDHPSEQDRSDNNPNKIRYKLYDFCKGNPSLMRELIKHQVQIASEGTAIVRTPNCR